MEKTLNFTVSLITDDGKWPRVGTAYVNRDVMWSGSLCGAQILHRGTALEYRCSGNQSARITEWHSRSPSPLERIVIAARPRSNRVVSAPRPVNVRPRDA
jgi:hypothetical protein